MNNRLICIVGPTSSGKTSMALKLSKSLDIEVISADSRQIYREMDIGTGKYPTNTRKYEKKANGSYNVEGTTIWGYDLISPNETFTAWEFAEYARNKINEISSRGKIPILVGGTGFYIDVATGKIKLESFKEDKKVKEQFSKMTLAKLQEKYQEVKSKKDEIDINNPSRLRRYLERSHLTKDETKVLPKIEMKILKIGLTAERDTLYERADSWVEHIWESNLIGETKGLLDKFSKGNRCLQGLIYKEAIGYIENKSSKEEAIQKTKYSIHAYIRRQLTWFKRDNEIIWFDINEKDVENTVLKQIKAFLG